MGHKSNPQRGIAPTRAGDCFASLAMTAQAVRSARDDPTVLALRCTREVATGRSPNGRARDLCRQTSAPSR